ncbi:MAG: hypothetical protein Kow0080_03380 [Candidatus Promineifilaceae bacterium]
MKTTRTGFRKEWLVVTGVAVIVAALFVLPYWLGHVRARPGEMFTGLLINLEDGSYLSAIEQGRQGAWVYENRFTLEPHHPVFIQGYYLALGHVARLLGVTAVTMWHVALWLADVFLFLLVYRFTAVFFTKVAHRAAAVALIWFGAGYDWWLLPASWERANTLEAVPMEPYVPELHLFYSALTYPHFIMGIAFILLVVWAVWCVLLTPVGDRRRWYWAVGAGLAHVGLGVVYPFLIFLTAGTAGLMWLVLCWRDGRIRWHDVGYLATAFLIPVPLFVYYAWAILTEPVFAVWNAQAVTLTPNPIHVLLAYLPYWLLGMTLVWRWRHWPQEKKMAVLLPVAWVVTAVILLYMPTNPQRRFVEGLQIPLAVLAALGWVEVTWPAIAQSRFMQNVLQKPRYAAAGMARLMTGILVGVVSLFSLYLYVGTVATLAVLRPYPLFRPVQEVTAMQWLSQAEGDGVVLSAKSSGSYIPYLSGRKVFVGQRYETIDYQNRLELAEQFFAAETPDAWRISFLQEQPVGFVFVGRAERELGAIDWEKRPYLAQVYDNGETAVYRVLPEKVVP